jgi:hypothetical protein
MEIDLYQNEMPHSSHHIQNLCNYGAQILDIRDSRSIRVQQLAAGAIPDSAFSVVDAMSINNLKDYSPASLARTYSMLCSSLAVRLFFYCTRGLTQKA